MSRESKFKKGDKVKSILRNYDSFTILKVERNMLTVRDNESGREFTMVKAMFEKEETENV